MQDSYSMQKVVQEKCFNFHHTISEVALIVPQSPPQKDQFYAQYADRKLSPIYSVYR